MEDEKDSAISPLDHLCSRMLSLGCMGGFEGGTDNMKASEIKNLLIPFFGADRIARCTDILCGKNDKVESGVMEITDEHCLTLDGTENLGTFGGEGMSHEDGYYPEYGLDFGTFKVFGLTPEQMSRLGCQIINHLKENGHNFIGGWRDSIEEV